LFIQYIPEHEQQTCKLRILRVKYDKPYALLIHLQLLTNMNLTFYIHQTIPVHKPNSDPTFFRKFKFGSEKCSRTPDSLRFRIRAAVLISAWETVKF